MIERFIAYDDVWWTTKMREAAKVGDDDPWLALVCSRRPGPESAWKRPLDFPAASIEEWNSRLPPKDDLQAGLAWEAARASLENDGVLVVRHSFRPWEPRDRTDANSESLLSLWDPGRKELIPLTRVSPITKSLAQAWLGDIQVHAFVDQAGRFTADEILARLPDGVADEEQNG